ncbi:MAG: SDR family oxidoreductase [Candidatus Brocadiae bacterium]|nr:SDR family oxidoreductase [Candidatus Brocadiia bacterium]
MICFSKEDIFLVTGASSGIGKEIALRLNSLGASVLANGRNEERLQKTKSMAAHPENFFLEARELTENIQELPLWVKNLKEKYGRLKGLISCAGVIADQPLQVLDESTGKKLFDVNYFAPVFLAKGFADRRVYASENASITFLASISAFLGEKAQTFYGASKAALIASAKTLSHELSPKVRVNCISPGPIDTEMTNRAVEIHGHSNISRCTLGIGNVKDVSALASFLVSHEARWITGQNYILDGGYI